MALEDIGRQCIHERKIAEALGVANLRFDGDSPRFEKPLVLLAFTNRSGSNLLADYLRQTGKIGGLGEHLNHDGVVQKCRARGIASMPDYLAHLVLTHSKAAPVFGVKTSVGQLGMMLRWNLVAMFPKVFVVHIVREDALAQAVSFSIARQSKQWTSRQRAVGVEPEFNLRSIDTILDNQHAANLQIELTASAHQLPLCRVTYEDLCATPADMVRQVMAFVGFDDTWTLCAPEIEKQANERNDAFVLAYRNAVKHAVAEHTAPKKPRRFFKW